MPLLFQKQRFSYHQTIAKRETKWTAAMSELEMYVMNYVCRMLVGFIKQHGGKYSMRFLCNGVSFPLTEKVNDLEKDLQIRTSDVSDEYTCCK